jgi:hypothetical protein
MGLGTTTEIRDPFTVNVQDWGPALNVDTTELAIGGGYVGATELAPGSGYGTVQTINAPNAPAPPFNFSQWIEQNKTAVYAGAGILALMAMFRGRR